MEVKSCTAEQILASLQSMIYRVLSNKRTALLTYFSFKIGLHNVRILCMKFSRDLIYIDIYMHQFSMDFPAIKVQCMCTSQNQIDF